MRAHEFIDRLADGAAEKLWNFREVHRIMSASRT
jgi:hypothetical protein